MTYKFRCEKCKKEHEVECDMSAYDEIKDNCYCECGGKCRRVFEPFSVEMNVGYNAENGIRSKWQG